MSVSGRLVWRYAGQPFILARAPSLSGWLRSQTITREAWAATIILWQSPRFAGYEGCRESGRATVFFVLLPVRWT